MITKEVFDKKLQELKEAYYKGTPLMSDREYDKLLDKYKELFGAEETVGAPVSQDIGVKRVKHKFPAKSLDKTKDVDKLVSVFSKAECSNKEMVLMWKLDGSTIQLTYYKGSLYNAATRGDGIIGQDITNNAKYIQGIPQSINDDSLVTVRGEAVISYPDFESLNNKLPDDAKYENPRNLASASISMKVAEDMRDRCVHFKAFEVVYHPHIEDFTFSNKLDWCQNNGFEVVEYEVCNLDNIKEAIKRWSDSVSDYYIPVDGLVVALQDTKYTSTLKGTEHHPHPLHGYAFKWEDLALETTLREVIWQTSRTGLMNPVAVFDPVRIEGTTVTRASLHNLSIMKGLHLRIGDRITVYKANKIIPQVAENLSDNKSPYSQEEINNLIGVCSVCGNKGEIQVSDNGIESVYCTNSLCGAQITDRIVHYCSRNCMDIRGISEATISKFIELGFISDYVDLYKLDQHQNEIVLLDSFGEKSWDNMWNSIQNSRNTTFVRFITALGIPGIGTGQAKKLNEVFKSVEELLDTEGFDYSSIEGFGDVLSKSLKLFIEEVRVPISYVRELLTYLTFEEDNKSTKVGTLELSGKSFVVTGKVEHFKNRDDIHSFIESHGGKVQGSVSSKTSYLVNNDVTSESGKNKKAKELGVPIISEGQLLDMVNV